MPKLKLQSFGYHLMWRAYSVEKTLMLGKIEGGRRRGQQRMSWLDGIISSMDMSLSKLWVIVKEREAGHAMVHGVAKSQMWLSYWTKTTTQKEWLWPKYHLILKQVCVYSLVVPWGILLGFSRQLLWSVLSCPLVTGWGQSAQGHSNPEALKHNMTLFWTPVIYFYIGLETMLRTLLWALCFQHGALCSWDF